MHPRMLEYARKLSDAIVDQLNNDYTYIFNQFQICRNKQYTNIEDKLNRYTFLYESLCNFKDFFDNRITELDEIRIMCQGSDLPDYVTACHLFEIKFFHSLKSDLLDEMEQCSFDSIFLS